MAPNFSGKRALVTGASQGIGRGLAIRLAECGAQVVAMDLDQKGLDTLKKEIPSVETICLDLRDWDSTRKAAEGCGPVDLLVNCAGIAILQPFGQVQEKDFDGMFGVNLKAMMNLSQVVANDMKLRKCAGSIVNISSQASKNAIAHHAVYNCSKAGVDMLTKIMALELGPHKIRTNAVNPTIVNTELARAVWEGNPLKEFMLSRVPLGRFCEVEDVVSVVVFLLSEEAAMINGAIIAVDGGATAC